MVLIVGPLADGLGSDIEIRRLHVGLASLLFLLVESVLVHYLVRDGPSQSVSMIHIRSLQQVLSNLIQIPRPLVLVYSVVGPQVRSHC